MIIELIGQPASGKTYYANELTKKLSNQRFKVLNIEEKINRSGSIIKLIWIISILLNPIVLFKLKRTKIFYYIKKYKKTRREKPLFYYKTVFLNVYLLKYIKKNINKYDYIIFSEGLINMQQYIFRNKEYVPEEYIKNMLVFIDQQLKLNEYYLYYVDANKKDILDRRIIRKENQSVSYDINEEIKDINLNDEIINEILQSNQINKRILKKIEI